MLAGGAEAGRWAGGGDLALRLAAGWDPAARAQAPEFHGERAGTFPYWPPMKSMTGYGRGECARDGFNITVELSSVNRKQAEVAVNLPRELELLETRIRETILAAVSRGRIVARISVQTATGQSSVRLRLNRALARMYAQELHKLAKELQLAGGVTLEQIMRAPGVLQTDAEVVEPGELWPSVQRALQLALKALLQMRQREGAHLGQELAARINLMRRSVARITARAPQSAERYRRQLIKRIRAAGLPLLKADDERLLKEVVFFADRSDIAEELTRLQSHFEQFAACTTATEPVGRTLDFLAQEMNREINTLGAKANDALISREVVRLKAELERFREQAMNIE